MAMLMLLGAAPLAEAQIMVSSTTATTQRIYEKSGREKGWVLRPEASFGFGFIHKTGLLTHLNGTFNYQFNPYFSVGAGSGLNVFSVFRLDRNLVAVPLFVDFRAYFCDRAWSPFVDLKVGFNKSLNNVSYYSGYYWDDGVIYSLKGFLLDGTFGIQHKKFDFGVSVGMFSDYAYDPWDDWHSRRMNMLLMGYVAYNIQLSKK